MEVWTIVFHFILENFHSIPGRGGRIHLLKDPELIQIQQDDFWIRSHPIRILNLVEASR